VRHKDLLSFERRVQIVDDKRQVRNGLHDLGHVALRVEAHPLDAVRVRLKAADMNAQLVKVPLPWLTCLTLSDFSQETVRLSKDKGSHRHDFQSSIRRRLKVFRRTKTLVKSAVSTGSAV